MRCRDENLGDFLRVQEWSVPSGGFRCPRVRLGLCLGRVLSLHLLPRWEKALPGDVTHPQGPGSQGGRGRWAGVETGGAEHLDHHSGGSGAEAGEPGMDGGGWTGSAGSWPGVGYRDTQQTWVSSWPVRSGVQGHGN